LIMIEDIPGIPTDLLEDPAAMSPATLWALAQGIAKWGRVFEPDLTSGSSAPPADSTGLGSELGQDQV
jgi:hypothetical protein